MFGYMKQLIVNGGGKFHVIRIGADTPEALEVKRGIYLADDWQEATEAEYNEQMAVSAPQEAPAEAPAAPEASQEAAPVETQPEAQG